MNADLQIFLLMVMRIGAFIVVCPGFSFKGIPNIWKVALTLGLALPLYPLAPTGYPELSVPFFFWEGLQEVLLGLAIGYVSQLFFSAIEMAGAFADVQAGFSMAQLFDSTIGVNASYLGRVYYWVSLAIYFLTDMHHQMIKTLAYSFEAIPVQTAGMSVQVEGILTLFTLVFEIALNLAAPLLIVALMTEILLGILSRTVPQINVLILSMPLKVLVVVTFLLAFLPTLYRDIAEVLPQMIHHTYEFINSLVSI